MEINERFKQERALLDKRPIHQADILPGTIKERHLGANLRVIQFGLETNLPDGSTHTKAYFCTDSGKLKLWNGSSWLSVTLS